MKRKEIRARVKTLLSELKQLHEQFSKQSRGLMPDYASDIYSGRLGRWCPLSAQLSFANHADDDPETVIWLEKELKEWQSNLDAEIDNLSRRAEFCPQYRALTERIRALSGTIDVDFYDSEADFGEQFQIKMELPCKKKFGMKIHYLFFNEYDCVWAQDWLLGVEEAHLERKKHISRSLT